MKTQWIVRLRKVPIVNDFRSDFFPRLFHYKKEALKLISEVKSKGGMASLERKGGER